MKSRTNQLWFYVTDYPAVRDALNEAYARLGVEEWSAEPAGVRGREDDADVTVRGESAKLLDFRAWLEADPFDGLMIEGEPVGRQVRKLTVRQRTVIIPVLTGSRQDFEDDEGPDLSGFDDLTQWEFTEEDGQIHARFIGSDEFQSLDELIWLASEGLWGPPNKEDK